MQRLVDRRRDAERVQQIPLVRDGVPRAQPIAPGIPSSMTDNIIVLEYGSAAALETLKSRGSELAAVLVEPVQSRRPELQPREFLHELRKVTEETGSALIFDEVVTGFRVQPGGAQAYFGVRADLATYGKVVGGGLPIGIVAGSGREKLIVSPFAEPASAARSVPAPTCVRCPWRNGPHRRAGHGDVPHHRHPAGRGRAGAR